MKQTISVREKTKRCGEQREKERIFGSEEEEKRKRRGTRRRTRRWWRGDRGTTGEA